MTFTVQNTDWREKRWIDQTLRFAAEIITSFNRPDFLPYLLIFLFSLQNVGASSMNPTYITILNNRWRANTRQSLHIKEATGN